MSAVYKAGISHRRLSGLYGVPLLTAGCASLGVYLLLNHSYKSSRRHRSSIILSPLFTVIPRLSPADIHNLPYPPDVLPGARDVDSPYGSIRVYEWGPEDGRRVLLIHGISTPCIALAGIAQHLAERGCRVMLFDLFGRGYSSGPDPSEIPYDSRLYTTQILLALSSSPVSWTGSQSNPNCNFNIIGYSLGGGIAADFTAHFPGLVSSLVLIAPSGIVRAGHVTYKSKILYGTGGWVPERLIHWLVKRRLTSAPAKPAAPQESSATQDADDAVTAEVGGVVPEEGQGVPVEKMKPYSDDSPLFPGRPLMTVANAVNWQIEHHRGFIPAFISSIRYAPIHNQHHVWKRIGQTLDERRLQRAEAKDGSRAKGEVTSDEGRSDRVLIILGKKDPIVLPSEVAEDARDVLGQENVEIRIVDAGHELPISNAMKCADTIWEFWEKNGA